MGPDAQSVIHQIDDRAYAYAESSDPAAAQQYAEETGYESSAYDNYYEQEMGEMYAGQQERVYDYSQQSRG
jgi:hypothetical protein